MVYSLFSIGKLTYLVIYKRAKHKNIVGANIQKENKNKLSFPLLSQSLSLRNTKIVG